MTIMVINNMKIGKTQDSPQEIRDKERDKASTRLDTRGNQKERKNKELKSIKTSRHQGITDIISQNIAA